MHWLLFSLIFMIQASQQAEMLWRSGERVKSLELMAVELARTPDDERLRTRIVLGELEIGRFQSALNSCNGLPEEQRGLQGRALYFLSRYDEALNFLGTMEAAELLMRAEALRSLGRFAELEGHLDVMREVLGRDNTDVRLLEAQELLRTGSDERAVPLLREVLAARPLEPQALFGLGRALLRLGEREEGLEILEHHRKLLPLLDQLDFARRGVALAPLGGPNQVALADALRALLPYDQGLLNQSRAAYDLGFQLATPGEVPPVALRCARFQWETLGDREAATELLSAAIDRRDDVRLRVRLADYFDQLGRKQLALDQLLMAANARPNDAAIKARIARLREEK